MFLYQSCQPRFHAGEELGHDASVPVSVVCCSYIKQHCACFQILLKSIFNVPVCYATPQEGKGSPYVITKHRVTKLIPVLGS